MLEEINLRNMRYDHFESRKRQQRHREAIFGNSVIPIKDSRET